MGGYDASVENLRVFVAVLESTNLILEDATPKLDALGQELGDTETELRGALVALTTDLESVQKEVEVWEQAALAAAKEVGAEAQRTSEVRLPALEERLEQAKQRVHGAVQEHGATLQAELDELETGGFDQLTSVLENEQELFERWTGEVGKALTDMHQSMQEERAEASGDVDVASIALDAARDAVDQERTAADGLLDQQLREFEQSSTQEVDARGAAAATTSSTWVDTEWAGSIDTLVDAYHKLLEALGRDEGAAIDEEGTRVTHAVETAGTGISDATPEFERAAVAAEGTAPLARDLTAMRPRVEQADREVSEIQALLEAVGP